MEFVDYYKLLELKKEASEKEIKKAYRRLARKYHPDVNPDDKVAEKKFKEINEAYEVLGNPENRKKYDKYAKYGKDWKHGEEFEKAQRQRQQSYQQYQGFGGGSQGDFGGEDFSDFFNSMFGGAGGYSRQRTRGFKGQDFNAELQLDIKEVYQTQKQVLTVNDNKIRLTIPAGIANGQTIRIKGKGGPGVNGGPNGDLFIKFKIINNTPFRREGNHLYRIVDIDLYTAVLGGEITVDTFDSKVKLKVPAATQNGTKVKLKGKGFPVYKKEGQFGDLIITYNVLLPTQLSEKETSLFQELKNLSQNG